VFTRGYRKSSFSSEKEKEKHVPPIDTYTRGYKKYPFFYALSSSIGFFFFFLK
jgi:hypothetical protein